MFGGYKGEEAPFRLCSRSLGSAAQGKPGLTVKQSTSPCWPLLSDEFNRPGQASPSCSPREIPRARRRSLTRAESRERSLGLALASDPGGESGPLNTPSPSHTKPPPRGCCLRARAGQPSTRCPSLDANPEGESPEAGEGRQVDPGHGTDVVNVPAGPRPHSAAAQGASDATQRGEAVEIERSAHKRRRRLHIRAFSRNFPGRLRERI
jgi:hypothetical protein